MTSMEAMDRVQRFVTLRTGMASLDPDKIASVWTSGNRDDEKPAQQLLLSDLRELLAAARASAKYQGVLEEIREACETIRDSEELRTVVFDRVAWLLSPPVVENDGR